MNLRGTLFICTWENFWLIPLAIYLEVNPLIIVAIVIWNFAPYLYHRFWDGDGNDRSALDRTLEEVVGHRRI
jgi:hypothetical protein